MSLLRPNTAKVERMVPGGTSNAGDPLPASPTSVITGLACAIGPASMNLSASLTAGALGPNMDAEYSFIADGVAVTNGTPGASVTINGMPYIVAHNGRTAFPDIRKDDRITRDDGAQFLVIGPPVTFADVMPTLQAHLSSGKAWG